MITSKSHSTSGEFDQKNEKNYFQNDEPNIVGVDFTLPKCLTDIQFGINLVLKKTTTTIKRQQINFDNHKIENGRCEANNRQQQFQTAMAQLRFCLMIVVFFSFSDLLRYLDLFEFLVLLLLLIIHHFLLYLCARRAWTIVNGLSLLPVFGIFFLFYFVNETLHVSLTNRNNIILAFG